MSVFTYLKRNRTLYRNLLDKETAAGRDLLDQDLRELELKALSRKVETCIKRINEFIEKLDVTNERMSTEGMEDLEQLMSADSSLIEAAMDCRGELESYYKTLQGMSIESQINREVETQMQQLRLGQQSSQSLNYSSVKLPKLEILAFNGDKMRWKEFWDTFEATIDRNPTLSDIEKLNYLNSKLTGEAKSAVCGLLISNENYEVAVTLLKERFGNVQSVVNCHYSELIKISPAVNTYKGLRLLQDQVEKHLRSLEALKQDVNQEVFISIITSKIPKDVLVQLEIQKGAKTNWTVSRLRELLNDYVSAREKAEQQTSTGIAETRQTVTHPLKSSTEALIAGPRTPERNIMYGSCRFCGGKHWNDECMMYPTVEARKKKLKGSCYICLKQGHITNDCTLFKSCYYCKQVHSHHRSLCLQQFGSVKRENANMAEEVTVEDTTSTENVLLSSGETVLMQTAKTEVRNPINGVKQTIRMLLDTGSQRTYVSEALAKALNLKMGDLNEISLITFGSERSQKIKTHSTKLDITLKDGSTYTINANVVPNITGSIHRGPINQCLLENSEILKNQYALADTLPCKRESSTIELLIGSDYYLDLILPEKVQVQPGLHLLASKLGWLLSGRTMEYVTGKQEEPTMQVLTYGTDIRTETNLFISIDKSLPVKANLEDFWKLETIGIHDSPVDSQDSEVLKTFHDSLQYKNGRYHVSWPWKYEYTNLPENRELAFGRLKSLINKMRNNCQLMKQYDGIIQEQLRLGVIEKVKPDAADSIKHYIPHHAVVNPTKTTTKVRVVYDASAKAKRNNKSLTECLYRGPVMLKDLTGILLRFRLNKVAVVADIEKAFLQIGLNDTAKDVTRFFWLKNTNIMETENNVQVYRFCRVPFGIISSPFLLGATLDFHLKMCKSYIADKIREDIYVDNVITGTRSTENAIMFYKEAKEIFAQAAMNLRDWTSNDTNVLQEIPQNDKSAEGKIKVLGLTWSVKDDNMALNRTKFEPDTDLSKRTVLKQIASVYDPLGLFSPITLQGKVFLQNLWSKKLGWDDTLPDEDKAEWKSIQYELKKLSSNRFPRYIGLDVANDKTVTYRLLGFCDASKQAYATVLYLHQRSSNEYRTDLVFSKVRLTPKKEVSIPRLELLATLIGMRAIQFVSKHLGIKLEQKHLWTDSQCVLNWIGNGKHTSKFVENRVAEIKNYKDIIFHYIPSKDNPADIASRGETTNELMNNKLWWHGPEWLLQPNCAWTIWQPPVSEPGTKMTTVLYEAKLVVGEDITKVKKNTFDDKSPFGIDSNRFSALSKLLKVTALTRRFTKQTESTKNTIFDEPKGRTCGPHKG